MRAFLIRSATILGLTVGALPSFAQPVGVKTLIATEKPENPAFLCNDQGLVVCQVFVEFGVPDDNLLNIGFSDICAEVDNEQFYQVPAVMGGADTAPLEILLNTFPELICDSFVTIGLSSIPLGFNDCTSLDPDFDSMLFNQEGHLQGGWFCNQPPSGQGLASNYPENRVLIGQFAASNGCNITGQVTAFYNDGLTEFQGSFQCNDCGWPCTFDPALCDDGNSCTVDDCSTPRSDCFGCAHRSVDVDGNGKVDAKDLSMLLGSWGPVSPPGTLPDFNADGGVNAFDLALLLGNWGPCP